MRCLSPELLPCHKSLYSPSPLRQNAEAAAVNKLGLSKVHWSQSPKLMWSDMRNYTPHGFRILSNASSQPPTHSPPQTEYLITKFVNFDIPSYLSLNFNRSLTIPTLPSRQHTSRTSSSRRGADELNPRVGSTNCLGTSCCPYTWAMIIQAEHRSTCPKYISLLNVS